MSAEHTAPSPTPDHEPTREAVGRHDKARLKIWFGMSAGVGKTHAMLEWARRSGDRDVVIGWIDTHGRAEIETLLQGLERLPPRIVENGGAAPVRDFDLDAALARKPKVLIVDELAHANAPGGRHQKRWQDVLDLLDAGIDVHTTLNVQHVDSLNDVIEEVTGVTVSETVPDQILDRADDIELIDLPPDDLLERVHQGKVHVSDGSSSDPRSLLERGNLLALRELALRRTADRVDADVRAWREEHAIADPWASNEKILVCVGQSEGSAEVIRAARRLADRLRAPWIALHVESADLGPPSEETRARVDANMHLAESLGAETVWLSGRRIVDTIIDYARRLHATRVLVGKDLNRRLRSVRRFFGFTLIDKLIELSGDFEIHIVTGTAAKGEPAPTTTRVLRRLEPKDLALSAGAVALATGVSEIGRSFLSLADVVLLYLLAITVVALRFGRRASLLAGGLSVLAYAFFFVEPVMSFAVAETRHVLTFVTLFVVGVLISTLTLRFKRQEVAARQREARTAALFSLSRDLGAAPDIESITAVAVRHASGIFDAEAMIYRGQEDPTLLETSSGEVDLGSDDLGVVRWVAEHERRAGPGADAMPNARVCCFPLAGAEVLVLVPRDPAALRESEMGHFAELVTRQIGLALARAHLSDQARSASVRVETEGMRSALLSSLSHDFETPLAAITAAASTLRDSAVLRPEVRDDLVESICDEAGHLEQLVKNLLEMTRLDSGAMVPHREWIAAQGLIARVLERFQRALGVRPVTIAIKPQVARLNVDPGLFAKLLDNLVDNAIKYSPEGTAIEIAVDSSLRGVEISVRDNGPGFEPGTEAHIFDRFFQENRSDGRASGLGLAIVQAIAHAHGGEMEALTRAGGGAIVTCTLPPEAAAPALSPEEPPPPAPPSPTTAPSPPDDT